MPEKQTSEVSQKQTRIFEIVTDTMSSSKQRLLTAQNAITSDSLLDASELQNTAQNCDYTSNAEILIHKSSGIRQEI